MVESNQNCHKCGSNMFYVKEIKKLNGIDVEFAPFVYLGINRNPQEVGYNEDLNRKKHFCEYCIPLVEKNYRGKKCSIWRTRYFKDKNIHTGQTRWSDSVSFIIMLNWCDEKLGWYDDNGNKYNFYEVFRNNSCQTCNNSLNQPSDNDCCRESQEKISKDKSNKNDNAERERAKMGSTENLRG